MQETMGQVIRRLRKERCITQEEMADALGVTGQAVSKWENDASIPDVSLFVPLANLFDISIDTLFSRESQTADQQVQAFLEELDEKNQNDPKKFDELSNALRKFPNHPDLLRRLVQQAVYLVTPRADEENRAMLTAALKAADRYLRLCTDPGGMIRMKEMKIDLLARAGHYGEAEQLAREFSVPMVNAHMAVARIRREQKDYPDEIRQRQESIAFILPYLADEIARLGEAYRRNGQAEEALEVHRINLNLPNAIHGKGEYHAPLHNFHAISGFDAAYCLVLLNRHEEAVDLLEKLFDYGRAQCAFCTHHAPLTSPLLRDIDMKLFHGEMREDDYLWKIQAPVFTPLRGNPRFDALLNRFADLSSAK